MNQSSWVGFRSVRVIASFGQFLMQFAHKLQFAFESMVRGKEKSGQPATFSVPLKQAARDLQVAQISVSARSATIPVLA